MIGFIGGGNMGEAIIKGILKSGKYDKDNIIVSDVSDNRLKYLEKNYKVHTTTSNKTILEKSNVIIIAVKPQIIEKVLSDIKDSCNNEHLFISIAAGVPISKIESILSNDKKIVRIMPNAAAFALESMSVLCFNNNIDENDKKTTIEIFDSIGKTLQLEEYQIDAVTALSGSGPGFVALILEAFSDAGVNIGLPRDITNQLVVQTFKGTIKLLEDSNKSFIDVKNMVTSPGGTTIAGIKSLEKGKLKATIMDCVEAAFNKSKELSK